MASSKAQERRGGLPDAGGMICDIYLLGVPLPANNAAPSTPVVIVALIYFALICFTGVRMLMSAPVASAEDTGPIAIIRRSCIAAGRRIAAA